MLISASTQGLITSSNFPTGGGRHPTANKHHSLGFDCVIFIVDFCFCFNRGSIYIIHPSPIFPISTCTPSYTQTQNHINHWKKHIGKRTSQITWTRIWDSFVRMDVTHFWKNSGPFVIILKIRLIGWIGISESNSNAGNGMIHKRGTCPKSAVIGAWDVHGIPRSFEFLFIQGKLAAKRDIIHRNPCFS